MQTLLFVVHHAVLDIQRHPHDFVGAAAGAQWLVNQVLLGMGPTRRWSGCCFRSSRWCWPSSTLYTMFMIVPIFNSMMRIDRCC